MREESYYIKMREQTLRIINYDSQKILHLLKENIQSMNFTPRMLVYYLAENKRNFLYFS
jgi:uncharacterized protein YlaN (UPF0358 family)